MKPVQPDDYHPQGSGSDGSLEALTGPAALRLLDLGLRVYGFRI